MSNKIPSPKQPPAIPVPWYRDYQGDFDNEIKGDIAMTRETLVALWALKNTTRDWSRSFVGSLIYVAGRDVLHAMRHPGAQYNQKHVDWVNDLSNNNKGAINDAISRGRKVLNDKSAGSDAWVQSLIASGALSNRNSAR